MDPASSSSVSIGQVPSPTPVQRHYSADPGLALCALSAVVTMLTLCLAQRKVISCRAAGIFLQVFMMTIGVAIVVSLGLLALYGKPK